MRVAVAASVSYLHRLLKQFTHGCSSHGSKSSTLSTKLLWCSHLWRWLRCENSIIQSFKKSQTQWLQTLKILVCSWWAVSDADNVNGFFQCWVKFVWQFCPNELFLAPQGPCHAKDPDTSDTITSFHAAPIFFGPEGPEVLCLFCSIVTVTCFGR